jgi:hypothetical protein
MAKVVGASTLPPKLQHTHTPLNSIHIHTHIPASL